jgi:hypothetical protein
MITFNLLPQHLHTSIKRINAFSIFNALVQTKMNQEIFGFLNRIILLAEI